MHYKNLTAQFITEVEEHEEEFMFKHLQQYCEGMSAYTGVTRVPKKLLLRALICFKEEHQEEYKVLMGIKEKTEFHCGIEESGFHAYNCNDCSNKCEEYYQWDKEMKNGI